MSISQIDYIYILATVITNLLSAIPFIGNDIVPFIWGGFSVSNPTIQRFFALHFLLPFILAALVCMHLMALHVHGSSNPLGITGNVDRLPMHPYFIFKDLVTVWVFLFVFSLFVFYSPNSLGQKWPICAICWKSIMYYKTTLISGSIILTCIYTYIELFNIYKLIKVNPEVVRYYSIRLNQQVTNGSSSSVGTSETLRTHKFDNVIYLNKPNEESINKIVKTDNSIMTMVNKSELNTNNTDKFNQWLAGLIDGDGYLGLTEGKYPICEITVGIEDEKMLRKIQNKFGGSIRPKSGNNSYRYRLSNRPAMIALINAINGNIRNSKRLPQLHKLCLNLNILVLDPIPLTIDNAWISGFFDADGTNNIHYYDKKGLKNVCPQLFISISNKYLADVECIQKVLGGAIYYDKACNGYYKWMITNQDNHMIWYNYILSNLTFSLKGTRSYKIKRYYELYNAEAYMPNSPLYNSWKHFEKSWGK